MPHDPDEPVHDPDGLLSAAAQRVAERADSPLDRVVIRGTAWFAEHERIRLATAILLLLGALLPGIVLLFLPDLTDGLEGFGYFGVFLTNLASTATLFIPVPGLTAAGQLLIINEAKDARFPFLIGVAGGLGMAIGEITAYYAGFLGAELARGRELPGPDWLRAFIDRVVRGVRWLVDRWGVPTLFVLSAVPNPLFEIAGITAGSIRMPMRQFLPAVTAGKIVRGVLLAYVGTALPFV